MSHPEQTSCHSERTFCHPERSEGSPAAHAPRDSSIEITSTGVLLLSGELTLSTVNIFWAKAQPFLDTMLGPIQLDLTGVRQSDSAGVALLIAWVRYAAKQNKKLFLWHLPKQMKVLIQVNGLSKILPIVKEENFVAEQQVE